MKKPTKADFNAFKKEFLRCVDVMGLHEWRITFEFCPLKEVFADIETQSADFIAHVRMTSDFGDASDAECFNPVQHGRHEAAHLMTSRLCYIARSRYIRSDDISEEWERVTRLIQRLLA